MPLIKDMIKEKIQTMLTTLSSLRCASSKGLEYRYTHCPEYKTDNVAPKVTNDWNVSDPHYRFAGIDTHYWLHTEIKAVKPTQGRELRFCVRTGREGTWDDDANPQFTVFINGKTTQALDCNHTWIPLEYGKDYDINLYLFTGMRNRAFEVALCVEEIDLETEALWFDIDQPFEAMNCLSDESTEYRVIRDSLDKALMRLDLRYPYSKEYSESVADTRKYLKEEFYEKICGKGNFGEISCLGHTHIDVAWLWTLAQTREKAQRSFSTVINMMRRFPEYHFFSSQPQLYKYVKESDPELYEEIKKRIKEGRWEPEGAMWLESDTNLVSGESLIRQIIYGKRFMREEFGADNKILWLPDVFGYSAALPQIMKKCGIDRFFTTKMYWNESNVMPSDLFIWEGLDGSEVFTAFAPEYVPALRAQRVKRTWDLFKNKSLSENAMMVYGWGDGGGGPTYEMIENYRRLNKGIPGMPKAVIRSANEYFDMAEADFKKNTEELKKEPRWVGEMYLEMHRGTYTSIAKNKKKNRQSEMLYFMSAEAAAVADSVFNGAAYPKQTLRENIEKILLNQFHDIIPGSSIKQVYDDCDKDYAKILTEGKAVLDTALDGIKSALKTKGGIFVYNASPFETSDTVTLDGTDYYAENVPPRGWKVISEVNSKSSVMVGDKTIENDLVCVTFDNDYQIKSVFDKAEGREVIDAEKTANRLEVYEDYPREFDAWEISSYYKQKMWSVTDVSGVEPLPNGIRIVRKYQKSTITQDVVLTEGSKRIDFITTVDWKEDHVLLRAAFPVDVHAEFATYDMQFGNVTRTTHNNTSWDEAQFEVCAHKWADLSESDYGVSLLSDCKYGYSVKKNELCISLLKAPTYPNPEADREVHHFTYSLYPHKGDFRVGGTVREGYKLNMPLYASRLDANDGTLPDALSLAYTDAENIVIETIKMAEEGEDIIVRLYDAYNSKKNVKLTLGFDFSKAYVCDMLENEIYELQASGRSVTVPVKNYEIVTLKFVR